MSEGKLIILSGPSGAGKSTVIRQILERHPDFFLGIRHHPAAQRRRAGWCALPFHHTGSVRGDDCRTGSAGV